MLELNRRTRTFALACLAGLGLLAGCSSSGSGGGLSSLWPFGARAEKPATVEINHDDYAKLGYKIQWTGYAAMEKGARLVRADVLGDVLVVIDTNAYLTTISTASGAARWATIADERLASFVGVLRSGRRLIVCSNYQAMFLDIETGTLQDKQRFERVVSTRPIMIGPYLVFGTRGGEVMAHLMINGFRAWGYALNGPIEADPVQMEDDAAFVSESGDVIVLDAQTGNAKARTRIYAGSAAAPATSGEAIYIASKDQSIYCIERFGGATRWRYRTDSVLTSAPVFAGGVLYVDVPSVGLTALDAKTGRRLWAAPGVSGTVIGTRSGKLLVWDGRYAVTLEKDGAVSQRVELPGVAALVTDRFDDGDLYVVRAGGSISRFVPR